MLIIQHHVKNTFLVSGEETKKIKDELKSKFSAEWLKLKASWKISEDYLEDVKDFLEENDIEYSEKVFEEQINKKPNITLKNDFYSINGDTKEIKEYLKEIGCSWMPKLKLWICSEEQKKMLEQKGYC